MNESHRKKIVDTFVKKGMGSGAGDPANIFWDDEMWMTVTEMVQETSLTNEEVMDVFDTLIAHEELEQDGEHFSLTRSGLCDAWNYYDEDE